ncbi:protein LSM14 homolog B isoform X1 [Anopheles bellator]|uniref:protein LSM14 homolog B isoform X1 n=1 Tax=Anopheles bellator TaxID=139047 RepID=UPI0026486EB3|nr:protein LSM14 homolog B isoform X1 [Anopheles bellator]
MSCPMPEIGSCISLISKADIRYEGLLFTVDPERCTIALARVKSYGTEDRETQFPIAPQNQCYDYILFRGTDIKDIRVINNNQVPNDPAIMQMHLPPQQQPPPQMAMQNKLGQPSYQSPQGFMMPQMGGPPAGPPGGPMGGGPPGGPMGGPPPPGHQPQMGGAGGQPYNSFAGMNNLGGSGSRSATPSNSMLSRKSPTVDIAVQTNQQQQQQQQQLQQHHQGQQQQQPQQQMMQQNNRDAGNNQRNKNNHRGNNQNNNQRERRDSGKQQQHQQQGGDNQLKDNFSNKPRQQQHHQQQQQGAGQNRGGWNNNRNHQNQNNGGGGNNLRGRPRGNVGQPQQQQGGVGGAGQRAKNLLKFENDYDFEQANNKFEELRSQLSKLKVGEEVKPEQITSETLDKKDDSGNETGAGEHEQEDEEVICYDKAKSFFDTISCEAVERAKGKQQRTDWRQERKLNTETFGVGSTRRGGYNRRGGYFNRGPNNYHRGGNNYRGGSNNYRGRSNNRNNQLNGGGSMSQHRTGASGGQQQIGNQSSSGSTQPNQPSSAVQTSQEQQQPAVIEVAAGK